MKRICSIFLAFCLCFSSVVTIHASASADAAVDRTSAYLLKTVTAPQVGSIGGEWAVIGLARSSYAVPQEYWDGYIASVKEYVDDCDGVLHNRKYTEYSRVILALTAIGVDPTNVAGYNLLTALGDYEKTIWQGMNGPAWALIALDAGNYGMPVNDTATTQASRALYVQYILDNQLEDGGWSLTNGGDMDVDITAMVLQALVNYQDQENVQGAIDCALSALSLRQNEMGGFSSWNADSSECVVQVIVALNALGISLDDNRFVKNGYTTLDNLMSYSNQDGSFAHTSNDDSNLMATEQALYALVSTVRVENAKSSLYDMDDVTISCGDSADLAIGLAGKNKDVHDMPIVNSNISFPDIAESVYETAILDLASRKIINGNPDGNFYPDNTMTRAEFATIVVNALGLTPNAVDKFNDVTGDDWFAPYVGTAVTYGIVYGTTDTTFNPNGTITRQDAAVMLARAAVLCGLDTAYNSQATRDILAAFTDYVQVSDYAQGSVAFCYDKEILDPWVMEIVPMEAISRGEIAEMLYHLLDIANLR